MNKQDTAKIAIGGLLFGVLTWAGFGMYTRPLAETRIADPIRDFLTAALAGDSAGLSRLAGDRQPTLWVQYAIREDSAAVADWAQGRNETETLVRGDTLWIVLFHTSSSPACSYYSTLAGAMLGPPERRKLVRLTATCPNIRAR